MEGVEKEVLLMIFEIEILGWIVIFMIFVILCCEKFVWDDGVICEV